MYNLYCAVIHMKEGNTFLIKVQKHTKSTVVEYVYLEIQDGRYFLVKLYMSLPIHRCLDLSNQLRIERDAIF